MIKPHLETAFNTKLYTIEDALTAIGWTFEKKTGEYGKPLYKNIQCCGENVTLGGWVGTEYGYCKKCGKGVQLALGFLPAGRSAVGMIDGDKYDYSDGRVWMLENCWGQKPNEVAP